MIGSQGDERMRAVDDLMRRYEPMINKRVNATVRVLRGRMVDQDDLRFQIRFKLWRNWASFRRPSALIHTLTWSVCCDAVRSDRRQDRDLIEECGGSEMPGIEDDDIHSTDGFDAWFSAEYHGETGSRIRLSDIMSSYACEDDPISEPEVIDRLRSWGIELHRGRRGLVLVDIGRRSRRGSRH